MKRFGVIGVVVKNGDTQLPLKIQELATTFSSIFVGRMGVPDRTSGYNAISFIVKGSNEEISAFTGKLGQLGVAVKSALTSVEVEEWKN